MRDFITIKMFSEDGDVEEDIKVPSCFEVCSTCEGCGTDRGRSVECDGGGFTASEWAEQDDDFKQDYLKGVYDKPCEYCKGLRVVQVIDRDRADPDLIERYDNHMREEAEYQAERRAEIRMGY